MTFDEIVTEIKAQLNLTSTEATTRIGRLVNRCYKRVTASIGLQMSRRTLAASVTMSIGSAEAIFTSTEKVVRVYYLDDDSREKTLDQVAHFTLREDEELESSDTPTEWAPQTHTGTSVTVRLNKKAATAYALKADVYSTVSTLATTNVPAFPESFHEILIEGVLKDEYKKMGDKEMSKDSLDAYREYLSNLRMWIAKGMFLDNQQGRKRAKERPWGRG